MSVGGSELVAIGAPSPVVLHAQNLTLAPWLAPLGIKVQLGLAGGVGHSVEAW